MTVVSLRPIGYRITQYYYIMYSTNADAKNASCVNKIMNYFALWTNHNTNRSLSIDRYPAGLSHYYEILFLF